MANEKYDFTDVWLLHSILFSRKGATLKRIISTGDYLNHAIFTYEELNRGLNRLIFNDFVAILGENKFIATQKAKQYYEKNKMENEGCIIQLFRMSKIFMEFPMEIPSKHEVYIPLKDYKKST